MKSVTLVGMLGPQEGDDLGTEVWGVNASYTVHSNLARLYFMDEVDDVVHPEFVENATSLGVPIYCRDSSVLPGAITYPLHEVLAEFKSPYFTSSVSYMLAHAILEGYERIHLYRVYEMPWSRDYAAQKSCLDFWAGVAIGRGVELTTSKFSLVGRANPWESSLYGYVTSQTEPRKSGIDMGIVCRLMQPQLWRHSEPSNGIREVEEAYSLHEHAPRAIDSSPVEFVPYEPA
jgi:hypothetical protein